MRFQIIEDRPGLRSKIERAIEGVTGLRFRYAGNLPKLTDRHLHRQAFVAGGGDASGAKGIIFDVGAHVGESALAFHKSFPEATIHSFEPVEHIFEVLRRNCKLLANIHCHNLALGDETGERRIALSGGEINCTMNSLKSPVTSSTPSELTQTIKTARLDDFCADAGINQLAVLKMDVEGFEPQVIDGAQRLLGEGRIMHLVAEVTLDPRNKYHTPLDVLVKRLGKVNYSLTGFYDSAYDFESGQMLFTNAFFRSPRL
jgi:FkbM family methyltransferase